MLVISTAMNVVFMTAMGLLLFSFYKRDVADDYPYHGNLSKLPTLYAFAKSDQADVVDVLDKAISQIDDTAVFFNTMRTLL